MFFYISRLESYKNFKNATFASFRTSYFSIAFPFFSSLENSSRLHKYRVEHDRCFFFHFEFLLKNG